jgi:hypothetical protein
MITVYLYPGEANPNDVILSDPTVLRSGATITFSLAATEGADLSSGAITTIALPNMYLVVTEGADAMSATVSFTPVVIPVTPPPTPDKFKGPAQPQGIVGRLILEGYLTDYGHDILFAISGLTSETITLAGVSESGQIVGYPELQYSNSSKVIKGSTVQNGTYVIHIDDLKPQWRRLVFIKSGSSDHVNIELDSQFEWVDTRR